MIRAEETYDNRAIAIHLFDTSDAVAGAGFDISQFQGRFVKDEFYRISGSLQWNLYCYLICNDTDYRQIVSDGRASAIERDYQYARKFVRTMAQIERELADKRINQALRVGIPKDIGVLWVSECENAGLPILTSNQPFDAIVAAVENRSVTPLPAVTRSSKIPECESVTVGRIDSVKPVTFRGKINGRKFEFGDVTLIHGPNGAGKTSIMEAIEGWICGGSFRNQKGSIAFNSIELQLRDMRSAVPGPIDDLQLYRARERRWFNVNQRRGVHLPQSFARFNFLHADSAARLEIAPDPGATTTALNDLVLGEETSRLRLQFEELLKRLNRRLRECETTRSQSKEQFNRAKESIAKVRRPSTDTDVAGAALMSKIRQVGWLATCSIASADDRSQLVSELTECVAIIDSGIHNSESVPFATENAIESLIETIQSTLVAHDTLRTNLRTLHGQERALQERVSRVDGKIRALERLLQYYDKGGIRLWDAAERERTAQAESIALENAFSAVMREDLASLASLGGTLEDCYNHAARTHRNTQSSLVTATERLAEAKDLAGRLEALASDSRSAALDYASSDKSICVCPVCLSTYTNAELLDRIKKPRSTSLAEHLKPLQAAVASAKSAEKLVSAQLSALAAIRSSVRILSGGKQTGSAPLREVLNDVVQWERRLGESKAQHAAIVQDTATLLESGFSLDELRQVLGVMSEYSPSELAVQREAVQSTVDDLRETKAAICLELAAVAQKRTEMERKVGEISDRLLSDASSIDAVRARCSRLKEAAASLATLRARVNITPDDHLQDIALRFRSLISEVESFSRLSQELEVITEAVKRFEREQKLATESMAQQTSKIEALEKAKALITRIQEEHDPQKTLSDFLRSTRCQIRDLFRAIHAPQEFDDLTIDDQGVIELRRTGGRGVHRVSEMSSGQRSALGIALFLTLNALAEKAPPLILLDDPIAHVDDLNILAFFDCLRELAIESKRQVFFATASTKAAGLFRKKFDFLGRERFRVHELLP